jgi:hypothetical protein
VALQFQGINSINDPSNGAFHPLKSCVSGLSVLRESLGHHLHHGANLFVANTFFFLVVVEEVVPVLVAW